MAGRYLLDTNIVIALFAADASIQGRLAAAEVFVPSIVVGELYYGARKSGKVADNVKRVDEFAADNTVLACDVVTAAAYGDVKAALRVKGRPLPENDVWIAALALQHDLVLASRDAHFNEVDRLRVEAW
jgi:tRNA(fMet)-specific endonuclease VapC